MKPLQEHAEVSGRNIRGTLDSHFRDFSTVISLLCSKDHMSPLSATTLQQSQAVL